MLIKRETLSDSAQLTGGRSGLIAYFHISRTKFLDTLHGIVQKENLEVFSWNWRSRQSI